MTSRTRRLKQLGFTLVELMVSMAIGLLLVLALITLLINVNRNSAEMTKTNRLIENGRFSLQLLQADFQHAGFLGGFVPQYDSLILPGVPADYPTAVPDPCLVFTTPWDAAYHNNLLGVAVQGYEIEATVPSPTLAVCASKVANPKARTDVVFVRHLATARNCLPPSVTSDCPAPTEGELYFQVARCGNTSPSPAYVFRPYVAINYAADFPLQNRDCATSTELRKFESSMYYIRDYAVTVGDGIPTLMRSRFAFSGGVLGYQDAQPLIEGVEGFRVEYGIDSVSDSGAVANFSAAINWADPSNKTSPTNRGDGIPDGAFVRCTTAVPCTVDQLANIVAVKLYVLARSERSTPGYTDAKTYSLGGTTLGPFNDGFKRHLFSQAVRITNVSARRETP